MVSWRYMSLPSPTTRFCSRSRISITPRDLRVLDTLARYGLVREPTLHALHFPTVQPRNQRHVQGVLKRLADHGYLGRRFLPPVHRLHQGFFDYSRRDRSGAVYFLTRDGATLLGQDYHPRAPRITLAYLHHRLDITDCRACFELAIAQASGITLARWIDENEKDEEGDFLLHDQVRALDPDTDRLRKLPIRPDAAIVLEQRATGQQELFFLEVDEGTESGRRRWRDKVLAYRAYAREGVADRFQFAGSGFRVLTLTRTPTGTQQDKRLATLLAATDSASGRKQFWFTTFEQAMPQGRPTAEMILSKAIWSRAVRSEASAGTQLSLEDYLFGRDLIA